MKISNSKMMALELEGESDKDEDRSSPAARPLNSSTPPTIVAILKFKEMWQISTKAARQLELSAASGSQSQSSLVVEREIGDRCNGISQMKKASSPTSYH